MKILIVYDTVFNNTKMVAESIGSELSISNNVEVVKADNVEANNLKDIDVLFVGSPTRMFQPTKNVRNFINHLSGSDLNGVKIAVFDTRMVIDESTPKILRYLEKKKGYANDTMLTLFEKKGGNVSPNAGEFYVLDTEGPLKEGEVDRIRLWSNAIISN